MLDHNASPEGHHKKSIVAMLIRLKDADGKESANEWTYIHEVASALGLDNSDVMAVNQSMDDYRLSPPQTEKERMTILYYLLFFMRIDGEIGEKEQQLVQQFGFTLGFHTSLTRDLIQVIKNHADQQIPPEEMIKAITKYLN